MNIMAQTLGLEGGCKAMMAQIDQEKRQILLPELFKAHEVGAWLTFGKDLFFFRPDQEEDFVLVTLAQGDPQYRTYKQKDLKAAFKALDQGDYGKVAIDEGLEEGGICCRSRIGDGKLKKDFCQQTLQSEMVLMTLLYKKAQTWVTQWMTTHAKEGESYSVLCEKMARDWPFAPAFSGPLPMISPVKGGSRVQEGDLIRVGPSEAFKIYGQAMPWETYYYMAKPKAMPPSDLWDRRAEVMRAFKYAFKVGGSIEDLKGGVAQFLKGCPKEVRVTQAKIGYLRGGEKPVMTYQEGQVKICDALAYQGLVQVLISYEDLGLGGQMTVRDVFLATHRGLSYLYPWRACSKNIDEGEYYEV